LAIQYPTIQQFTIDVSRFTISVVN